MTRAVDVRDSTELERRERLMPARHERDAAAPVDARLRLVRVLAALAIGCLAAQQPMNARRAEVFGRRICGTPVILAPLPLLSPPGLLTQLRQACSLIY